jgi:hypothetical protein
MEHLTTEFKTLVLDIPPECREHVHLPAGLSKMNLRQVADFALVQSFDAFMRYVEHPDTQDLALRWSAVLTRLLVVAHRIRNAAYASDLGEEATPESLPVREWGGLFSEAEGEDMKVRRAG